MSPVYTVTSTLAEVGMANMPEVFFDPIPYR